MVAQPIDYFLLAWFVLAALSTAYVAWDQFKNNPEPVVMKWGFILVTLYMGPIGLLLYVMADKEPRPGEHEEFIKPLWKQGVGSTIHCVAGDATGIILVTSNRWSSLLRYFRRTLFERGRAGALEGSRDSIKWHMIRWILFGAPPKMRAYRAMLAASDLPHLEVHGMAALNCLYAQWGLSR